MGSWKNDSLWLKEYRLFENDTVHIIDEKVDYIIGSDTTPIHIYLCNGYVHQMPYTYYTQDKIFDLPPGFENGNNSRFDREIGTECMSCHNAMQITIIQIAIGFMKFLKELIAKKSRLELT